MKYKASALWGLVVVAAVSADDTFNYDSTSGSNYGPEDWDEVQCDDLATCPGWPDKALGSVGWQLSTNVCESCPIEGNNCGQHRQSPIDLMRDRAIAGNPNEKECPDWHWITYIDGSCSWEDMADSFVIGRSSLQIHMPLTSSGDIDCVNEAGERKFPKTDYSKGFPDWWYLSQTDISVPSEHVQQGKRYAAEVKLSHFYEIDHYKNKLGVISFFMQDFEGEPSWPYLDKLICKWRHEEEQKRLSCDLPPAPVYKMCELYRGQVRTEADLEVQVVAEVFPTFAPLVAPPAIPVVDLGADPEEFRLPLGLCEGDCDFETDCAPGLLCFRRDAFEAVPGCIGGESDATNNDYCIFDPYGPGYAMPTPAPTITPTITARPTLTPLDPQPLVYYGGTPPLDKLPLLICEGDCDKDDDCNVGLICFQRTSNETVPGCLGGELDTEKTDYCIMDPYGPGFETRMTTPPTSTLTQIPSQKEGFPTTSPSKSPTKLPAADSSASSTPTSYPSPVGEPEEWPPIEDLGWTPPEASKPLGRCKGDCDIRQDCAEGLDCFQRYLPNLAVPGCTGGELDDTLTDYCVPVEMMNMVVTQAPGAPTSAPQPATAQASDGPSAAGGTQVRGTPPLTSLQCTDYSNATYGVRFDRLCSGCCSNPRSSSEFCWESYEVLAGEVESACYHCCLETQGEAKVVGPAPVENPAIPQDVLCSGVENADRMCRDDSCCDIAGSTTAFCKDQYSLYTQTEIQSICWYCCHPSKEVDFDTRRHLTASSGESSSSVHTTNLRQKKTREEIALVNEFLPVGENDRITHDVNGRTVIVRSENFEDKGLLDEEAYFRELIASYKRRALQVSQSENYDDVPWWPYEWFLKVGTEYYFRYEGTQTAPPCYDTTHWRVFKDPIRVAPHQMRELERLIAWRQGDNCETDTAGKATSSPDVVDVARPLQSLHRLHRLVFCECQDWPSKFPADRQWCRNWQTKAPEERLFGKPYNFPSNGFDFLQ